MNNRKLGFDEKIVQLDDIDIAHLISDVGMPIRYSVASASPVKLDLSELESFARIGYLTDEDGVLTEIELIEICRELGIITEGYSQVSSKIPEIPTIDNEGDDNTLLIVRGILIGIIVIAGTGFFLIRRNV